MKKCISQQKLCHSLGADSYFTVEKKSKFQILHAEFEILRYKFEILHAKF